MLAPKNEVIGDLTQLIPPARLRPAGSRFAFETGPYSAALAPHSARMRHPRAALSPPPPRPFGFGLDPMPLSASIKQALSRCRGVSLGV